MKSRPLKHYIRIIIFIFLVLAALYFGAAFFIPFFFGVLLAMLMTPAAEFFEKKGINRWITSILSTLAVFVVVTGIVILLINQLATFSDDLPQLQSQLERYLQMIQQFLNEKLGIPYEQQMSYIQEKSREMSQSSSETVETVIGEVGSVFLKFLLTLIYMFLFMLNRGRYRRFLTEISSPDQQEQVFEIANKMSRVAHHYLWGRIQVMSILAVMYVIAFLIFGIQYWLLLTVFGVVITIIPYVGPFVSGILPILTAILTGEPTTKVLVFTAVILVIQLIESYVLEPVILGSEVNLSPLAIIIIIIIGGYMWGIAGMILFVPLLSMVKIYLDHMENLAPFGRLLGNSRS